jgi:hypothetical protein
MADIVHRVQMKAGRAEIFAALAAKASCARNAIAELRLDTVVAKMEVAEVNEGARVVWRCVDGPADWIGTDVAFDLAAEGDETVVRFRHRNWRETTDFMGHCSTKWAFMLFDLKARVETPEPDDLYV